MRRHIEGTDLLELGLSTLLVSLYPISYLGPKSEPELLQERCVKGVIWTCEVLFRMLLAGRAYHLKWSY